ncbi:hypothetical protein WOA01_15250 [Methylocystis sp. IM2]|uniref:hypothetical protein n=1 Tax=Methylocystis sp. IM2 TaxID=3136563 RepID=UPI0030F7F83B
MADMLAEAGAPRKPELDELTALVHFIRDIPSLIDDRLWLAEQLKKENIYERAQQAANDLRRYSMMIAVHEEETARFVHDAESTADAEALADWLATIPDFTKRPMAPKFRETYDDPSFFPLLKCGRDKLLICLNFIRKR